VVADHLDLVAEFLDLLDSPFSQRALPDQLAKYLRLFACRVDALRAEYRLDLDLDIVRHACSLM
jgi:hypothetical protein